MRYNGVIMNCREFRCSVKHDIIMDLAVILAIIMGISVLSLTNIDLVKLLLAYFLVLIPLHEYAHYFTLRFLGKNAKR